MHLRFSHGDIKKQFIRCGFQELPLLDGNTVNAATAGASDPNRFATTRWSVVLSCANSVTTGDKARQALAELCRIYWRPIFAFICRRGYTVPDAQDLTQDFFLMVLEGNLLSLADPLRGRFRSLLLKALQNFLNDKHERRQTQSGPGAGRTMS